MSEEKSKTIIQTECPHCAREIYIPIMTSDPEIKEVYSKERILINKDKVKTEVREMIGLNSDVSVWLDSPETIILDEDIIPTVEHIKQQYGKNS